MADLDALFDQLDNDGNGFITREEFDRFLAGLQDPQRQPQPVPADPQRPPGQVQFTAQPPQLPPLQGTMVQGTGIAGMNQPPGAARGGFGQRGGPTPQPSDGLTSAIPLIMKPKKTLTAEDELVEEDRFMRDARRAFALGGTVLLLLLAFFPTWGCMSLLHSPTYNYFSTGGSGIGGILLLLDVLIIGWMFGVEGIFPSLPISCPCSCNALCRVVGIMPSETYIMTFLTIFLLMVWKVLPMLYIGGVTLVLNWMFGFLNVMWVSHDATTVILTFCLSAVLLYSLSLSYFFHRAKPAAKGRVSSMFAIWTAFATMMAVGFIFYSMPVKKEASMASEELLSYCETGQRTRDLFITSQALQSLRQTPGCAGLQSVEECTGFQTTVYSKVLKDMEFELRCGGFCYDPKGVRPLTDAPTDALKYPPTLFSKANYQASCEGMAARNMQNSVSNVATQIFQQGMFLLTVCIGISLLYVIGACTVDSTDEAERPAVVTGTGYGAVA